MRGQPDAEVGAQGEVFLLDPGMGPETWLTLEGRVLLDERGGFWGNSNSLREATEDEAVKKM